MMNRIIMGMGCIVIAIIFAQTITADELRPNNGFFTTYSQESMVFCLGEITMDGTLNGIETNDVFSSYEDVINDPILTQYINTDIIESLHVLPSIGAITITNISNITLINQNLLESFDSDDLLGLIQGIQVFSDVSISLSEGFFLIGTNGEPMEYTFETSSGFSGFIPFPFDEFPSFYSFFCISEQESDAYFTCNTNQILLYPLTEESTIHIQTSTGQNLWHNENEQFLFFLENDHFRISEESLIHFIPLSGSDKPSIIQYTLQPSTQIPQIMDMIQQVENIEQFDSSSFPLLSDNILPDDLIASVSSMINGGMVFVNHSNTLNIDGTDHLFQQFGFLRVHQATIKSASSDYIVQADYASIFLGDHFYSSQASTSENGVSIPIIPIVLWIGAILCILIPYILQYTPDKTYGFNDKKIYYISILAHSCGYIVAFFLIDNAVYSQFGISFFHELTNQGFSLITILLIIIQAVLWILGFLFAALPLSIIVSKLLHYFGFDKTYRHFSKSITALSIWPLVALYLTMFVNIVFLFFNPFNEII